jgi:hypothetical protein
MIYTGVVQSIPRVILDLWSLGAQSSMTEVAIPIFLNTCI